MAVTACGWAGNTAPGCICAGNGCDVWVANNGRALAWWAGGGIARLQLLFTVRKSNFNVFEGEPAI